jgi:lipoate-protein ligase A
MRSLLTERTAPAGRASPLPPARRLAARRWELLLDPTGASGAVNMAIDAGLLALAERTGRAFLRLYRFDPPCLSFGRNEPVTGYDRSAITRLGVDVVRRPTGGRAVWHEHELTYAVAAPIAAFGSLRLGYWAIQGWLAAALRTLGAEAALALQGPRPAAHARSGACFAAPVGGEVLVDGRKLVGSAQARRGRALLQHGSVLLAGSQDLARLASGERGARGSDTTLATVCGRPVSFEETAAALVEAWDARLVSPVAALPHWSPVGFRDPAWTWRR